MGSLHSKTTAQTQQTTPYPTIPEVEISTLKRHGHTNSKVNDKNKTLLSIKYFHSKINFHPKYFHSKHHSIIFIWLHLTDNTNSFISPCFHFLKRNIVDSDPSAPALSPLIDLRCWTLKIWSSKSATQKSDCPIQLKQESYIFWTAAPCHGD